MRTMLRFVLGLLALACVQCGYDRVHEDDVVTVQICPDTEADEEHCDAEPIANGSSTTIVQVCTPVEGDRALDLKVAVQATAGEFMSPKDPTTPTQAEIVLGRQRCQQTTLMLPQEPGFLRVDAELGGFTARTWVDVVPAPIEYVTIDPSVHVLAADEPTSFDVSVQATSGGGAAVSIGSRATIEVVADPASAHVAAFPASASLDADGHAKFSVHAPAHVKSVTVTVSVEPPDSESYGLGSEDDMAILYAEEKKAEDAGL